MAPPSRWIILAALALLTGLPGCVVRTTADTTPAAYAPAYSQASPYAAPGYAYSGDSAEAQPYDSYCAEAVGEAQAAAAQASVTGAPVDVGRARRTAGYARRDC